MATINLPAQDDDALFCNAKWSEANWLLADSWTCYMELGKELRQLKEGKYNGRFVEWCGSNLDFSYEWANKLIKAYSRYELSGCKDEPVSNIELYAENEHMKSTSYENADSETEENMPKQKKTKESTGVKVMSKIDIFCDEQGFDDLQTEVAKAWYRLSKSLVKKYGNQAIDEAILLINDTPTLYKEV